MEFLSQRGSQTNAHNKRAFHNYTYARNLPVDGNADQNEAGQIETEHAEEGHQAAHQFAGAPLHGVRPADFERHQDECDKQVGQGQMDQHQVHARRTLDAPLDKQLQHRRVANCRHHH